MTPFNLILHFFH